MLSLLLLVLAAAAGGAAAGAAAGAKADDVGGAALGAAAAAAAAAVAAEPVAAGVPARMKAFTTLFGVQQIQRIVEPELPPIILGLTLPDVSGTFEEVGQTVSYDLTDIKLTSVQFGQTGVELRPGQPGSVVLSMAGIQADIDMNWRFSAPLGITGSGSAKDELVFNSIVELVFDELRGRPLITVTKSTVDISSAKITVSNNPISWFYNFLINIFKSKIESEMQDAIASSLQTGLNDMSTRFSQQFPASIELAEGIVLNYAFTETPQLASSYAATWHRGYWSVNVPAVLAARVATGQTLPAPLAKRLALGTERNEWVQAASCSTPPDVFPTKPPVSGSTFGFELSLDKAFFSCLGDAVYTAGLMHYTVTNDEVPSDLKATWDLNTSNPNFAAIAPQLSYFCKDCPMTLELKVTAPPTFGCDPTQTTEPLQVHGVGNISVIIHPPGKAAFVGAVFSMTVGLRGTAQSSARGQVTGTVTSSAGNCKVLTSAVGPVSETGIEDISKAVMGFVVLPKLNEIAKTGFPLPTLADIELVRPSFHFSKDRLDLLTDVKAVSSM